jgi:hypothetical protein
MRLAGRSTAASVAIMPSDARRAKAWPMRRWSRAGLKMRLRCMENSLADRKTFRQAGLLPNVSEA